MYAGPKSSNTLLILTGTVLSTNGISSFILRFLRKGNVLNVSWKKNTDTDLLGYNIFANNYWIGTVDADDTNFSININQLPFTVNGPIKISIEAFDRDGETSKNRSSFTI